MRTRVLLSGVAIFSVLASAPLMAQAPSGNMPTGRETTVPESTFSATKDADIVGADGQSVATLRDVLVGRDGHVRQLLLGEGGLLGLGETLRVMNTDRLPPVQDGKVQISGLTKESLAALPEYKAAEPAEAKAATGSPPVSGANQPAPQSAEVNVPVKPSVAADAATPSAPQPDVQAPLTASPSTQEEAENSRASGTTSVEKEESATGSGSGGMAPQQGTGSGATQSTPQANENQGRANEGNSAGSRPDLNAQYGVTEQPVGQSQPQDNADEATSRPTGGDAVPAGSRMASREESVGGAPSGTTSSDGAGDGTLWRLGKIVGESVRGKDEGLSVKDVRLSGPQAVVLLQQSGVDGTRMLEFSSLNLGGTPDDPEIALGVSADARPADVEATGAGEVSR
ncbi:hypothetical protein [Terrihabitans rhizophilus]|uniref:PRC-barrel domain-containing protein n=1 Tax=Terrihabitans rhizophilus TaxID=3092662 RepID=A0ABU4RTC9_9HYPH|nr:hypothetical protein [Terrihabitans sp. PJ23]MDX6807448.1 hypothetical protein [Terrihabitans sp. PJ23]